MKMLLYIWFQSKLWPPLATILNFRWAQKVTRAVKDLKMNIQITFPYHLFSVSWKKIIEKLTMFPMSPDDHLLTNRKKSLIWSKQTPNPSVQFLLDMSCYLLSPSETQNRCQRRSKFALEPYVKQHFHGLLGKHWTEFNHNDTNVSWWPFVDE
jgi:hypothetical protein